MEPILIYYLKVNIALALFYMFYRLCFRQDTFLELRRFLLIVFYPVAFLYPFIDISSWLVNQPQVTDLVQLYESSVYPVVSPFLNTMSMVNDGGVWDISDILFFSGISVYMAGVMVLIFRRASEMKNILYLLFNGERRIVNGMHICYLPHGQEPFSFFKWIFIQPGDDSDDRWKKILLHEKTHISQRHSLDVLLGQFVFIFCWINPFAWLLKKEICMNHEFLADRGVIYSGADKKEYQYYLIGIEHKITAAAELYNYFSVLPLKKIIIMLNKKRTRCIGKMKGLLLIPLVTALLVCTHMGAMARMVSDVVGKSLPDIKVSTVFPASRDSIKPEAKEGPVFTIVAESPEFPGGMEALCAFINKTMKYPKEAVEKKIEGRVVVDFIVNKDGSLSDIKLTKSVNKLLDDEAIRIVKAMPKWEPGKQDGKIVRSRFALPIRFTLK